MLIVILIYSGYTMIGKQLFHIKRTRSNCIFQDSTTTQNSAVEDDQLSAASTRTLNQLSASTPSSAQ
jgi:hypothetical protein